MASLGKQKHPKIAHWSPLRNGKLSTCIQVLFFPEMIEKRNISAKRNKLINAKKIKEGAICIIKFWKKKSRREILTKKNKQIEEGAANKRLAVDVKADPPYPWTGSCLIVSMKSGGQEWDVRLKTGQLIWSLDS